MPASRRLYPLITLLSSSLSSRFLHATLTSSGRSCSSQLSLGWGTPTARQMEESAPRAIRTAVSLALLRFRRSQSLRP